MGSTLTVRLSADLRRRLEDEAMRDKRKVSDLLRLLVEAALDARAKGKGGPTAGKGE